MIVSTHREISLLEDKILKNAEAAFESIKAFTESSGALSFFSAIKFTKLGKSPISGDALNLIEQINQTHSNLVVLSAAHDLLNRHPGKTFRLCLGVESGYDIQSTDGEIIAECFAVTRIDSNDKMNRDCKRLLTSSTPYMYIYFRTYEYSEKQLENYRQKYPAIHFHRFE